MVPIFAGAVAKVDYVGRCVAAPSFVATRRRPIGPSGNDLQLY